MKQIPISKWGQTRNLGTIYYQSIQDNCKSHSDLSPESVLRELFEAAAAELRDEVNVPVEHQHGPELLGVVRDLSHGGRCGLEFLIRLKVRAVNSQSWGMVDGSYILNSTRFCLFMGHSCDLRCQIFLLIYLAEEIIFAWMSTKGDEKKHHFHFSRSTKMRSWRGIRQGSKRRHLSRKSWQVPIHFGLQAAES